MLQNKQGYPYSSHKHRPVSPHHHHQQHQPMIMTGAPPAWAYVPYTTASPSNNEYGHCCCQPNNMVYVLQPITLPPQRQFRHNDDHTPLVHLTNNKKYPASSPSTRNIHNRSPPSSPPPPSPVSIRRRPAHQQRERPMHPNHLHRQFSHSNMSSSHHYYHQHLPKRRPSQNTVASARTPLTHGSHNKEPWQQQQQRKRSEKQQHHQLGRSASLPTRIQTTPPDCDTTHHHANQRSNLVTRAKRWFSLSRK